MERNTIAEMKEIVDAFAQGKELQYQSVNETHRDDWIDCTSRDAALNFFDYRYRIKPEKKWRPFKDVDEFIRTAGGLSAIWIKRKTDGWLQLVLACDPNDDTSTICVNSVWISFNALRYNYTFLDGTPCGVEEDA